VIRLGSVPRCESSGLFGLLVAGWREGFGYYHGLRIGGVLIYWRSKP
jgi:hypothetical protein